MLLNVTAYNLAECLTKQVGGRMVFQVDWVRPLQTAVKLAFTGGPTAVALLL